MNRKTFHEKHHEKIQQVVHKTGLGTIVPSDETVLQDAIHKDKTCIQLQKNAEKQLIGLSGIKFKMKKKIINKNIVDFYLTSFIQKRILDKENICFEIEYFKKKISYPIKLNQMDKLLYAGVNFQGWRKYPTQSGFNYYMKYKKEPWTITII